MLCLQNDNNLKVNIFLAVLTRTLTGDWYDEDDDEWHEDAAGVVIDFRSVVNGVETNFQQHRMMSSPTARKVEFMRISDKDNNNIDVTSYNEKYFPNQFPECETKKQNISNLSSIKNLMIPKNIHPFCGEKDEDDDSPLKYLYDEGSYPDYMYKSILYHDTGMLEYIYHQYVFLVEVEERK